MDFENVVIPTCDGTEHDVINGECSDVQLHFFAPSPYSGIRSNGFKMGQGKPDLARTRQGETIHIMWHYLGGEQFHRLHGVFMIDVAPLE